MAHFLMLIDVNAGVNWPVVPRVKQTLTRAKNQRKAKGQNRFRLFHTFSQFPPQYFPLQNKGFQLKRTIEKKR